MRGGWAIAAVLAAGLGTAALASPDVAVPDNGERLMRLTLLGRAMQLDKAADVLTKQGWRWVEVHGDERKPYVAAWRMGKTDNESVAAMMTDIRGVTQAYDLKIDKIEVSPTPPKAR